MKDIDVLVFYLTNPYNKGAIGLALSVETYDMKDLSYSQLVPGEDRFLFENTVSHVKWSCSGQALLENAQRTPSILFDFTDREVLLSKDGQPASYWPLTCAPGISVFVDRFTTTPAYNWAWQVVSSSEGNKCSYAFHSVYNYTNGAYQTHFQENFYELRGTQLWTRRHNKQYYRLANGKVIQDTDTLSNWSRVTTFNATFNSQLFFRDSNTLLEHLIPLVSQYAHLSPDEDIVHDAIGNLLDNVKNNDVNTAQYLLELKDGLSMFKEAAKIVTDPLNPKSWASTYLSAKWGTMSTLRDSSKLLTKALKTRPEGTGLSYARGMSSGQIRVNGRKASQLCCFKAYYLPKPGWGMELIKKGLDWGLWPSFNSFYDFIPFSFIAGWFSNIDDVIEDIDRNIYVDYLRIVAVLQSTKNVLEIPLKTFDSSLPNLSLTLTVYQRVLVNGLPVTAPRKLSLEKPSATNVVDGGALFLQRRGR